MTGEYFSLLPWALIVAMGGLLMYFMRRGKPSKLKAWIGVVVLFAGSVWMGWEVFSPEGGKGFAPGGEKYAVILLLFYLGGFFLGLKQLNALRTREP